MTIRKGNKLLIIVITIFIALPPFAIDTYITAFSQISTYFNVSSSKVVTSVSTYTLGFALGMLIWGAISDRFGRKIPLSIGMLIYTLSTILCSLSKDFNILLVMRLIQGLSDSSGAVISFAIIRDLYKGKKLIIAMATMTMVFMIAPIVAPIIGSLIIYNTGEWQHIFHFLTLYGIMLFTITFFIPETLKQKNRAKSILNNVSFYIKHLINIPFMLCSIAAGICFGSLFIFISSSSVLIIDYYKFGYSAYCTFFAINLVGIIFVNFIVTKKVSETNQHKFISTGYTLSIISLMINIILGYYLQNIYIFILFNAIATANFSLIGGMLTSKALNQVKVGFGSANAMNSLLKFGLASFTSLLISQHTASKLISEIPFQQLTFMLVSLIIFLSIRKKLK